MCVNVILAVLCLPLAFWWSRGLPIHYVLTIWLEILFSSSAFSCRCTDGGVYLIFIAVEMLSLGSLVLLGLWYYLFKTKLTRVGRFCEHLSESWGNSSKGQMCLRRSETLHVRKRQYSTFELCSTLGSAECLLGEVNTVLTVLFWSFPFSFTNTNEIIPKMQCQVTQGIMFL